MNPLDEFKKKLSRYSEKDVIFTKHAKIRLLQRNISLDEVKRNILNPKHLLFAKGQKAKRGREQKYDCYFIFSKGICHRYVLIANKKIIICTVIKINRRWQKRVEKHAKI